jgi:hypothetical protein
MQGKILFLLKKYDIQSIMFFRVCILDTIKGLSYYACSFFKAQLKGFWRNNAPGY